jgi:ribosomal-protein-serine acetyltransferase
MKRMADNETVQNHHDKYAHLKALPTHLDISDKLAIRRVKPTDKDELFAILEYNPDIGKYVAWASKVESAEDVVPRLRHYSNEDMDGRYLITSEEKVVGYIGIHPGSGDGEYGIGYCLDKDARGQGYVTDAVAALTEQARTQLGARQVYLQIILENEESNAVPERLGFYRAETVMGVDFPVEQQRWRLDLS